MTKMESSNYIAALKTKKLSDVSVAQPRRLELRKKQGNKCSECKKDLRSGYYNFQTDPKTKETKIICSNCAVKSPKR